MKSTGSAAHPIQPPSIAPQWNAAEYAANSSVQQNWARELIAKLHLRGTERILDVGCGDGKITAELARAVPQGSVLGVDFSPEMVAFANAKYCKSNICNFAFQRCDARKIGEIPGQFDLVFSNAALHWVDDHEAFLSGAAKLLTPGGRLLVSCGGKGNAHDVFVALRPEMRLARWRAFFRKMPTPYHFYSPEQYGRWLPKYGFRTNAVTLTPKDSEYAGAEGLATWLRSTWLPYVQRVPLASREDFIAAVTHRYIERHPLDATGMVHVGMVRLEIDATKMS